MNRDVSPTQIRSNPTPPARPATAQHRNKPIRYSILVPSHLLLFECWRFLGTSDADTIAAVCDQARSEVAACSSAPEPATPTMAKALFQVTPACGRHNITITSKSQRNAAAASVFGTRI